MITTYQVRTLPLKDVLQLAIEAPDHLPVYLIMVRTLASRALAEICARDQRISELENQIAQLKGEGNE